MKCPCAAPLWCLRSRKKPGPTKKLSQIGKHSVWGCLALQHMLCDCAFKATCQKKLVCSRPHMSASRCICLTPRLGTPKKRLLTLRPSKISKFERRVQILVLGPGTSQEEPESGEGRNPRKSAIPDHLLCAREGKFCVVYAGTQQNTPAKWALFISELSGGTNEMMRGLGPWN